MKISASEISTFLACRREWDFSSPNRQNLGKVGRPARALWLGTGVHAALEAFYRDGRPLLTTFRQWVIEDTQKMLEATPDHEPVLPDYAAIETDAKLGLAMLEGYLQEYGWTPEQDVDGLRFLATELEFSVPIPGTEDGELVGTMDGVVEQTNDNALNAAPFYWVVDHKTASQFPKSEALRSRPQFTTYVWAASMLAREGKLPGAPKDTRVLGIIYNGLRKQLPGPSVHAPLFRRDFIYKRRDELVNFERWLAVVHNSMVVATTYPGAVWPTFGPECDWCDFLTVCRAKEEGDDWEWLLSEHYRAKEPRGVVYANGRKGTE